MRDSFVLQLSTIDTNMDGESPRLTFSSGMVSVYHDEGVTMSSRRWIHSKNSRWESSHHSLRNCSETVALDSANNVCHFQTVSYGSGSIEYTSPNIADGGLQAPRKPLRRESLEEEIDMTEAWSHGLSEHSPSSLGDGPHMVEACPHELSEHISPCRNDNDSDRTAPLDYPILPTSSPRTTIRLRAIRPPTKPVRRVSCDPLCSIS